MKKLNFPLIFLTLMPDLSEETRRIYHAQHMRIVDDERAMNRFIGMFSTEYFGLDNNYFKNKRVLDAGCGDTSKLIIALHRFGARDIHGLELGNDFISVATKSLKKYGVSKNDVTFTSGNVLKIPYDDDFFDFVACHGVLLHLNNMDEVKTAFSELTRVTKQGGCLYTVFGNVGGLFEDCIVPALRNYYKENSEFRNLIDKISKESFAETLDFIMSEIEKHTGEKLDLNNLKNLLDTDLCVTIQNVIQAPVRLKIDEYFIRKQYTQNNFHRIHRLKRYVKRENIRKYLAPLHFNIDYPISKILYGSGNLEFIGQK